MSKQYIEINGLKHYLDEDGDLEVPDSGRYLDITELESLGFEIQTEGPAFENIPDGIYSPGGEAYNKVFGIWEGRWHGSGREEVSDSDLELLKAWHRRGRLFKLEKGKATNE